MATMAPHWRDNRSYHKFDNLHKDKHIQAGTKLTTSPSWIWLPYIPVWKSDHMEQSWSSLQWRYQSFMTFRTGRNSYILFNTLCSGQHKRKHQNSTLEILVRGILSGIFANVVCHGTVSISDESSYCKISWCVKATRPLFVLYHILLKIDKSLYSRTTGTPITFKSDRMILYR